MSEKPFWEGKTLMEIQNLDQHLSALVFRCGGCRYKPYALALKSKPAVEWEWPKDMMLAAAIRRWNAMCNGDKRYRLIYESLGGRR